MSNLQTYMGLVLDNLNMVTLYIHMRTRTDAHRFSHFSWPSLVPVVVYPDWTMWLPCGCQAAPLLCGNWCLWYCRVATMLWLTGLATCPALAANMVWKGARREGGREGGGGTGLVGGEGSTCHMGQGGCDEICDGQAQGRFSVTGVMASAFISPFHQAAKICV